MLADPRSGESPFQLRSPSARMKLPFRPAGIATASVACTLLLAGPARADIFKCLHDKCHHDGVRSGVRAASNVGAGSPIYLPLASPAPTQTLTTIGLASAPVVEHNPLATAHAAEVAMVQHERAKAALKAEIEASNRVLQRMAASSDCNNGKNGTTDLTGINTKLDELAARMSGMETRLTAVEKLLLTHDNFLKDMVEKKESPQAKK